MTTIAPALRMQVTCNGILEAEVIVEFDQVGAFVKGGGIWERYANAKHRAGKPCGGAIIQRADLPRYWNVPVGSRTYGPGE